MERVVKIHENLVNQGHALRGEVCEDKEIGRRVVEDGRN